jgi:hypothetical protein
MIDALAAIGTIIGAFLVASKSSNVRFVGFTLWIGTGTLWLIWGLIAGNLWFSGQYAVLLVSSILGAYNSIKAQTISAKPT